MRQRLVIAMAIVLRPRSATPSALRVGLPGREVVVLSDGDPSLVGAVRAAVRWSVTHILDWFHISMRVRHIEGVGRPARIGSDLEHKGPLDYAGFNVDRLRHLIWKGYADEARRALPSIMHMAANAVVLNGQKRRSRIARMSAGRRPGA